MNFGGTAKAAVLVGSIDGNITLDQVYSQLAADAPQLEAFDIREISNGVAGKLSLVVVCLKAQAQELEEALRMQGFARPAQLVSEVPAQELENLKNEVVRIQEESEQIRNRYALFTTGRALFNFCPIISGSVHRNMRYSDSSASPEGQPRHLIFTSA